MGRKNKEQSTAAAAAVQRRLSAQHRIIKRNGEEFTDDGPQPSMTEKGINFEVWAKSFLTEERIFPVVQVYGRAEFIKNIHFGLKSPQQPKE